MHESFHTQTYHGNFTLVYRNGGEYPRAFVVRREGGRVTDTELVEMVKERFAPHKWLTGGVYFIEKIPRTGSGKVVRRMLVGLVGGELGSRAKL
jgi:acyl-coenzyme A synthetase/AMP-(fatty) acid ligase